MDPIDHKIGANISRIRPLVLNACCEPAISPGPTSTNTPPNPSSKSDKDIIAALLNVADSRFQAELLAKAKAAGKIPADYEIPERYRNNVPEALEAKFRAYRAAGFFPPYPFGNDFSDEEMILARALKGLKAKMGRKVGTMSGGILKVIKGGEVPARALPYLRRMKLDNPVTFKDKVVQSLLISELIESGHA